MTISKSRRLFLFAEFVAFGGILASGYVIVAASGARAIPVVASDQRDKLPTAKDMANPAAGSAPTLAPATRVSSAKPPVPLRVGRHATFWIEDPQPPATTTEAAVTEQIDRKTTSDATAKAMIEADGYKKVRAVAKAPDGSWRGFAMRGAVEVAVSVDDSGNVTTQ